MSEKRNHVYLVRGLSGSGKTSFVESVLQDGDVTVAADDFMVDEKGEYHFEGKRLPEVHERCRQVVEEAMQQGVHRIFVHNTFATKEELEPYVELAERFGYYLHSIITEHRHKGESKHGIPESTLEKRREKFDVAL